MSYVLTEFSSAESSFLLESIKDSNVRFRADSAFPLRNNYIPERQCLHSKCIGTPYITLVNCTGVQLGFDNN